MLHQLSDAANVPAEAVAVWEEQQLVEEEVEEDYVDIEVEVVGEVEEVREDRQPGEKMLNMSSACRKEAGKIPRWFLHTTILYIRPKCIHDDQLYDKNIIFGQNVEEFW